MIFVERSCDFFGGKVVCFFLLRGCVIFFVERLLDFFCGEVARFVCGEFA